jgi:mRNA-degrading endonuclease YafQ of YafQ-DinJ toxin-antitoxin module
MVMLKDNLEIPDRFWSEYEIADSLERKKKIKKIVDMIIETATIDAPYKEHAVTNFLQSYFDDIIEYKNKDNMVSKE